MGFEAVHLIKEKKDGELKGRTCGNGARQRRFMKEGEDISSPTASLKAIITTLVIDAYECRDIVIVDVHGAYLHAKMSNKKGCSEVKGCFCRHHM